MKIRKATEKDIPNIVNLLKLSLGESLTPKTEAYWSWKHINNPFGQSFVLLAEEAEQLIGVRAFMRWEWQHDNDVYKAVRAVDTATHPAHQGKGVFKRLTLAAVEEVKKEGAMLVFNSPNPKSMPGYIKMGWINQGRMPVKLKINPFAYGKKLAMDVDNWENVDFDHFLTQFKKGIHTVYSANYLKWRYVQNPVCAYNFITDHSSYLLIYRYKDHAFGTELRIVDIFIIADKFIGHSKQEFIDTLNEKSSNVFLTSASANQLKFIENLSPHISIIPSLLKGPIITLKNLNFTNDKFDSIASVKKWAFSFGDIELF